MYRQIWGSREGDFTSPKHGGMAYTHIEHGYGYWRNRVDGYGSGHTVTHRTRVRLLAGARELTKPKLQGLILWVQYKPVPEIAGRATTVRNNNFKRFPHSDGKASGPDCAVRIGAGDRSERIAHAEDHRW